MRIDLLMAREPFPDILCDTLATFWTQKFDTPFNIVWNSKVAPLSKEHNQTWLVNYYINAIFVPHTDQALFDPIKREFSRSPIWWKRPLQYVYVQASVHPLTSARLAQASLSITPPLSGADHQLIIPGNHKIRWIDGLTNRVYGIRKTGFHSQFMRQEIQARQIASDCGVPIPPLIEADQDSYEWFCESFISGTPLNRLADTQKATEALGQIYRSLIQLYDKTAVQSSITQHANHLKKKILDLANQHHLLSDSEKTTIIELASQLAQQITNCTDPIKIALTHGDFQPANILINNQNIWLIDWEYAEERIWCYDALVFQCESRISHQITKQVQAFVTNGFTADFQRQSKNHWSRPERQAIADLYMLEECCFQLTQTNQPLFTLMGSGWKNWLKELTIWVTQKL